jgi:hypothetical protein
MRDAGRRRDLAGEEEEVAVDEDGNLPVIVAAPKGYSSVAFVEDKRAVLACPHLCAQSHHSQPDPRPPYVPAPPLAKSAGLKARRAWDQREVRRKKEWARLHPEPKKLSAKERAALERRRNAELKQLVEKEAKAAKAEDAARAKEAAAAEARLLREKREGKAEALRLEAATRAAEAKADAADAAETAAVAAAEAEKRRNETPAQRQYREAKERKEAERAKERARRAEEAAKKKAFDDESAAWKATQVRQSRHVDTRSHSTLALASHRCHCLVRPPRHG